MNANEILKERKLPELLSREQMKKILQDNEYGYIPDVDYKCTISEPEIIEKRYLAGTVCHSVVNITIETEYGKHTFPVNRVLHNDGEKHPFFVFLNFRADVPDRYYPLEEVIDEGFDVLSVCYKDITSDDGDFKNGLAGVLLKDGQETDTTCGKIMMWAWTASRILDYAQTLDALDMKRAAVMGHSRLGKTALVAGMMDERFTFAFSNCSGNSGAALSRGNTGETITDIVKVFPFWFCKNYRQFTENNYAPHFDQHFLVASIAPRYAYVASATLDAWADPNAELLTCVAASKMYEDMGLTGFVFDGELPKAGDKFLEGRIGYHNHHGNHFLSRHAWKNFMEYMELHKD